MAVLVMSVLWVVNNCTVALYYGLLIIVPLPCTMGC